VWTRPFALPKTYLFSHCDLAYATTPHAAQGRTVDTTHSLVDGLGDRQGLYVAMSRGQRANYAYAVTGFPRAADARVGSRPAAELVRARRLTLERAALNTQPDNGPPEPVPHRDRVSVLRRTMRGCTLPARQQA
jgi:hypothetical protein